MFKPISLWNPTQATSSDDAGTTIIKSVLPPAINKGLYEDNDQHLTNFRYVPSLAYFAIRRLVEYPDLIDLGVARIHCIQPSSSSKFDILRALLPGLRDRHNSFSLSQVDPRLWAVIIQVFANLPNQLKLYPIPLSDKHLPLLQRVPATQHFCLVTVLDLARCRSLMDNTIVELKSLTSLCALDASSTALTGLGIKRLSGTLLRHENGQPDLASGPWRLRMLRLRNCCYVDNTVYSSIASFPLLCVVDLRGTRCVPDSTIPGGFAPGYKMELYDPIPIHRSLKFLSSSCHSLFSAPEHFTLHVTSLHHAPRLRSTPHHPSTLAMQDVCVVFPAPGVTGSTSAASGHAIPSSSRFASTGPQTKMPLESGTRILDSYTVTRQTELRDEMRGREFVHTSRLDLLKSVTDRLHEDTSHLERRAWGHSDEYLSCPEQDEESESFWSDDSEENYPSDEREGDESGLFDEAAGAFDSESIAGLVRHLTTTEQMHPLHSNTGINHQLPLDALSGEHESDSGPMPSAADSIPVAEDPDLSFPNAEDTLLLGTLHENAVTPSKSSELSRADPPLKRSAEITALRPNKRRRTLSLKENGRGPQPDTPDVTPAIRRDTTNVPFSRNQASQGASQPTSSTVNGSPMQHSPSSEVAHPSMTLELQSEIVEAEIQQAISGQTALAFYHAPPGKAREHIQARTNARRVGRRSLDREESLMLYRRPPPWNSLDTWKSAGSIGRQLPDQKAILNTANAMGRGCIQALTDMINRRKIAISHNRSANTVITPESRNPFRPQSKATETRAKPLVSISTLAVPVLPQEVREQALSDGASSPSSSCQRNQSQSISRTVKRGHVNASITAFKKGSRLLPTERSPRGFGEAARARSKAERAMTSKAGGNAAVKSKTANVRSTFDWKAWSKSQS